MTSANFFKAIDVTTAKWTLTPVGDHEFDHTGLTDVAVSTWVQPHFDHVLIFKANLTLIFTSESRIW